MLSNVHLLFILIKQEVSTEYTMLLVNAAARNKIHK